MCFFSPSRLIILICVIESGSMVDHKLIFVMMIIMEWRTLDSWPEITLKNGRKTICILITQGVEQALQHPVDFKNIRHSWARDSSRDYRKITKWPLGQIPGHSQPEKYLLPNIYRQLCDIKWLQGSAVYKWNFFSRKASLMVKTGNR